MRDARHSNLQSTLLRWETLRHSSWNRMVFLFYITKTPLACHAYSQPVLAFNKIWQYLFSYWIVPQTMPIRLKMIDTICAIMKTVVLCQFLAIRLKIVSLDTISKFWTTHKASLIKLAFLTGTPLRYVFWLQSSADVFCGELWIYAVQFKWLALFKSFRGQRVSSESWYLSCYG